MFASDFFIVKNTTVLNSEYSLHRQNAWSEKDLNALIETYYSKSKQ